MDKLTWLDEKNDFLFIYCYTQKLETQISKSIWCHAFWQFWQRIKAFVLCKFMWRRTSEEFWGLIHPKRKTKKKERNRKLMRAYVIYLARLSNSL